MLIIEGERKRCSLFREANLLPKLDRDSAGKEQRRQMFLENVDAKILREVLAY